MKAATLKIDIWTHGRKHLAKNNENLPELFEPHVEHIRELLAQDYTSGQIVDERFEGWWTIEVQS